MLLLLAFSMIPFYKNWKEVKFKEILIPGRTPCVLCEYQDQHLLITLSRSPFTDHELFELLHNMTTSTLSASNSEGNINKIVVTHQNDKYLSLICSSYYYFPNELSMSCIYPSTPEDIERVRMLDKMFFFRETMEIYETLTLKWLQEHLEDIHKKNQWIRNLFNIDSCINITTTKSNPLLNTNINNADEQQQQQQQQKQKPLILFVNVF